MKLAVMAENRAAATDRRLAAINHAAMLLMLVVIAAILTTAMVLQFVKGELPCSNASRCSASAPASCANSGTASRTAIPA